MLGVSLAVCRAAALAKGVPLLPGPAEAFLRMARIWLRPSAVVLLHWIVREPVSLSIFLPEKEKGTPHHPGPDPLPVDAVLGRYFHGFVLSVS